MGKLLNKVDLEAALGFETAKALRRRQRTPTKRDKTIRWLYWATKDTRRSWAWIHIVWGDNTVSIYTGNGQFTMDAGSQLDQRFELADPELFNKLADTWWAACGPYLTGSQ